LNTKNMRSKDKNGMGHVGTVSVGEPVALRQVFRGQDRGPGDLTLFLQRLIVERRNNTSSLYLSNLIWWMLDGVMPSFTIGIDGIS
jgi:hypothetical protein